MHAERLEDRAHRAAGDDAGTGRSGAQDDAAGAVATVDVVVQGAALPERHADQTTLGRLGCLADRFRHFTRLAMTEADTALLVADDDERRETESTSTLHHLGDAVDMDEAVNEFAVLLVAVVTIASAASAFSFTSHFISSHLRGRHHALPARFECGNA